MNIPGGAYAEGQLSNVALNRPIGDIFGAFTYLDPETGLDISGATGLRDQRYERGH